MKVCMLGAGIAGTTTALRLSQETPAEVTLMAERLSPNTTSDSVAGWWEPHLDPDTPKDVRRIV